MAQNWRCYKMEMVRHNPQTGSYVTSMEFIGCSKANAEKQARNYSPIYGGMSYNDKILEVSEPLIEGVDFRLSWNDYGTSHPYRVGKKLSEPDVDFIKSKMAEDEKYAKIYWDLKKEGKIK